MAATQWARLRPYLGKCQNACQEFGIDTFEFMNGVIIGFSNGGLEDEALYESELDALCAQ
jgi:hypothetical protein